MRLKDNEYIKFILIGDNFDISIQLRERAEELGMDTLYDLCDVIAKAFTIYDVNEEHYNTMSMYDSLVYFLRHYEDDVKAFINNTTIDLIGLVRSDYE